MRGGRGSGKTCVGTNYLDSVDGKRDGEKWTDLRNISQTKRVRLAEGLDVEGGSEEKEGVEGDSNIAGMNV